MKPTKFRFSKGNLVLTLVCLLLAVSVTVGGTLAYQTYTSNKVENRFSAGTAGCQLTETVSNNSKTSILVTNNGDVPVYLRICLITYWQNADGSPVGKAPAALSPQLATGWVQYGSTYYYTAPVPGGGSVEFLSGPLTMVSEDGLAQVIEVLAESIQAAPAEAITTSWGRQVSADGTIIG